MEDKKVKRNYARKAHIAFVIMSHALIFTSCSTLSHRRDDTAQVNTVPKEQYDELVRKYQELINKSKEQVSQVSPTAAAVSPVPTPIVATESNKNEKQVKPEVGAATNLDPSELVNSIDKAIPDTAKVETVDALSPEAKVEKKEGPPVPTSMGVQHVNNTDDIDDQISRLREVQELVKVNKFENALVILKELENSKEKQIVVRAKVMLGDLLFNQGEYDLASQVYEEVIKKYAFSGYVLKSLGRLVACSEKLKQPEKQAKYYSLLHDFFEAG